MNFSKSKEPMNDTESNMITNVQGACQTDIGEGWDLIDSDAFAVYKEVPVDFIATIHEALKTEDSIDIERAIHHLNDSIYSKGTHISYVREVLAYGAKKYSKDNWRGISVHDHLIHALRHYIMLTEPGATPEDIAHCHCRLHMALAKALRPDYYGQFTPKK